jgi:hypothetical protein
MLTSHAWMAFRRNDDGPCRESLVSDRGYCLALARSSVHLLGENGETKGRPGASVYLRHETMVYERSS